VSHELQDGKWLIRLYVGINNLYDEDYNNNIRINASGSRFFEPAPDRNFYAGIFANYARTDTR